MLIKLSLKIGQTIQTEVPKVDQDERQDFQEEFNKLMSVAWLFMLQTYIIRTRIEYQQANLSHDEVGVGSEHIKQKLFEFWNKAKENDLLDLIAPSFKSMQTLHNKQIPKLIDLVAQT